MYGDTRSMDGEAQKAQRVQGEGWSGSHKPLLLLVVLELAEQGVLPTDVLPLTPELAFRFCSYWSIVAHRRTQRPDVRLPFHHLQTDGFWSALAEDGRPSPDDRLTRYANFTSDFIACTKSPAWRDQARRILIARYFQPDAPSRYLHTPGHADPERGPGETRWERSRSPEEARKQGREVGFRLNVVAAYGYACTDRLPSHDGLCRQHRRWCPHSPILRLAKQRSA